MSIQLVSFTLEIRYESKSNLVEVNDLRPKIYKEIIGSKPNEIPPKPSEADAGFELKKQEKSTKIVTETNRFAILIENQPKDVIITDSSEIVNKVMNIVNYENLKIIRIGVKTIWISSWDSSFAKLLTRFKEKIYKDFDLLNESADIAVNLTLMNDNNTVNYIAGPMKDKQLSTMISYPKNLPHDAIVVIIDEYNNQNNSSRKNIISYIKTAINYAEEKSANTYQLISEST